MTSGLPPKIEPHFLYRETQSYLDFHYYFLKMSFLNTFVNFIQKVVLVLIVVPAVFKLFEFLNNINQTINCLHDSLDEAEFNVRQLRTTVEDLKAQIAENNKNVRNQMLTTMDMQQQLVDHSIDAISTTKDISDIYDCLDLIDDRILNISKSEKAQQPKMLDKKHKDVFENFISNSSNYFAIFSNKGILGSAKLCKLFQEWYNAEYANLNDCPSNSELEEYMCHNFHWTKDS